jgi:predicted RNA-binding protein with PIN domain
LLEAAIEVARQGETADPVVRAPTALRPYLRFRRLTPKALGAARGVLDADEGFRERVSGSVSEDRIGSPAWRWLTRPDGWEADWDRVAGEVATADAAAQEASEVRRLQRELAAAKEAVRRADDRARRSDAAAAGAAEALDLERAQRTQIDVSLEAAHADVERLRDERAVAVRSLKDLERVHMATRAELRQEVERRREAEAALGRGPAPWAAGRRAAEGGADPPDGGDGDRGRGAGPRVAGSSERSEERSDGGEAAGGAAGPPRGSHPDRPGPGGGGVGDPEERSGALAGGLRPAAGAEPTGPAAERAPAGPSEVERRLDHVAEGVRRAADAARELALALAETAAALDGPADDRDERGDGGADDGRAAGDPRRGGAGAASAPASGGARGGSARPKRRPVPVPAPLLDDSPAAASHLLRLPGAYLLVDGYNVSMTAWDGVAVAEQRDRLLDLLDELQARTGVTPVVVFDGVSGGGPQATSAGRSVRVRFTESGTEADDVLIAMVDEVPRACPAVVVSSDARVREGAQRRGANVVGAAQFLAAAGRS